MRQYIEKKKKYRDRVVVIILCSSKTFDTAGHAYLVDVSFMRILLIILIDTLITCTVQCTMHSMFIRILLLLLQCVDSMQHVHQHCHQAAIDIMDQ